MDAQRTLSGPQRFKSTIAALLVVLAACGGGTAASADSGHVELLWSEEGIRAYCIDENLFYVTNKGDITQVTTYTGDPEGCRD